MKLFKSDYQKQTFLFFTCAIFALSVFITVMYLGSRDSNKYEGGYTHEMLEHKY